MSVEKFNLISLIKITINWLQGIPVKNMTSSFSDGVAFCAIVHFYFPNAFAFEDCLKMPRKERITFAFQKAESV